MHGVNTQIKKTKTKQKTKWDQNQKSTKEIWIKILLYKTLKMQWWQGSRKSQQCQVFLQTESKETCQLCGSTSLQRCGTTSLNKPTHKTGRPHTVQQHSSCHPWCTFLKSRQVGYINKEKMRVAAGHRPARENCLFFTGVLHIVSRSQGFYPKNIK